MTQQEQEINTEELVYSIGAVVSLTGISHGMLRLWEREGLVAPRRTTGGHRFYTNADLLRLRRIVHLRRIEGLNTAAIRRELGPGELPAGHEASETDPVVSTRLRALRLEQGLSLAEVAESAGLSVSFLSAVERGQASISLGNLFKLADALGTTVPGLSDQYQREQRDMLHPQERPRLIADAGRVTIEDLITRASALEAQRIEIQPGGGSEDAYAHPGEEFIYVLSGELGFWIGEQEQYILKEGDSLCFLSTRPHRWRNESSQPVTVLWINVPVIESNGDDAQTRARQRSLHHR